MRSALAIVLLSSIVSACAGSPAAAPSTQPPRPSASGTPVALTVGGDHPTPLVAPSAGATRPAPLIILLHGFGASGAEQDGYMHISAAASGRGAWFSAPDGSRSDSGVRFWNATDACCDADHSGIDDSAYLAGLIEDIEAVAEIDPKRVYLVGHSNGGFMSYRLACDHADRIAAIVSLAGATWSDPSQCRPSEPVAVLQIHGTADDTVLYRGGTTSDVGIDMHGARYPGVDATIAAWSTYDGCQGELVSTANVVDVDESIDGSAGPAEATVFRAEGCRPGGAVELWKIPGGGHVPELAPTFAEAVLDFLFAHPKP